MKKTAATLLAAAVALMGTSALAQATSSVVISGTVAEKCSAVEPVSGAITLGELAKSNGSVDAAFANNKDGLSRKFTVRCNGSNPLISVDAKPLVNAAVTQTTNGYTNTVGYTAKITAKGAKGGNTDVSDLALNAGATTGRIGDRLAAEANNLTLTISDGITANSTAILEAGSYAGTVDIIIGAAI